MVVFVKNVFLFLGGFFISISFVSKKLFFDFGPAIIFPFLESKTLPKAFTTINEATLIPEEILIHDVPIPPLVENFLPSIFPTVQPVPAPKLPVENCLLAVDAAMYPDSTLGRIL